MNEAASTPDKRDGTFLAPLLLSGAMLIWAGNFIAGRAVREALDPLSLTFWRWVIALGVLLPLAWPRLAPAQLALVRAHWLLLLALGATGVAGFNALQYLALAHTPALNALLVAATAPAVIALLAWVALGERLPAVRGVGSLISLAGVLVLIAHGDPAALAALRPSPGDAIMAGAVLVWSAYTVLLRRRPAGIDPVVLLATMTLAGVATLLPPWLWLGARMPAGVPSLLAALLYVALLASVVAFLAWNRGVALIGPARAGTYVNLLPVFGAALAILLLGERIAPYHLAGAALVGLGLALPAIWPRLAAARSGRR